MGESEDERQAGLVMIQVIYSTAIQAYFSFLYIKIPSPFTQAKTSRERLGKGQAMALTSIFHCLPEQETTYTFTL